MSRSSPQPKRNTGLLIPQADGSIVCGTCKKEQRDCLVWNAQSMTYDYRLRPLNAHEKLLTISHPEIGGPIRVIVEQAQIHGSEYWILVEETICAAGYMLVTGLSSSYLRSKGASLPGRAGAPQNGCWCHARTGRRSPAPLKFNTRQVYDAIFRGTEPIPTDSVEFLRLVAIIARRVRQGEQFEGVLRAYADDLSRYVDFEPADEMNLDPEGDERTSR